MVHPSHQRDQISLWVSVCLTHLLHRGYIATGKRNIARSPWGHSSHQSFTVGRHR